GSEIVRVENGAGPVFGAGSNEPSQERNWQKIEWKLASGDRLLLETSIFQFDGQNPYAVVGGPKMPMYRVLELKKKALLGWKTFFKRNEYEAAFEVLNTLIRSTARFRQRQKEGAGASLLITKQSYQHARFGGHEYFNVADQVEVLSDFIL